jgi:O-antigen/teichoic acid export membrane protein
MSDRKPSVVKTNLIANYMGQGWTAFINLALIPVYIAYLGIESYALVGIFTLVLACFTILDAGMTPTLNREAARFTAGEHEASSIVDLVRSIEILCIAIVLVVVVLGSLSAQWLAAHWLGVSSLSQETKSRALVLIVIVASLRVFEGVYRGALLGLQKHLWLNVLSATVATVRAVGAVAVLKWVSPSIGAFFIWQAIASVAALLVFASTTWRALPHIHRLPRFSTAALSSVKAFASGIIGTTMLALLLTQIDKVLLTRLLSMESFAYYSLGTTVAYSLYQLVGPVAQSYYPRFTELVALGDELTLGVSYHQAAQILALAVVPAAMLLMFFGERLLYLWTSNAVLSASTATVLLPLVAGCLFNGLNHIPYMLQLANGRPDFAFRINLVGAAIYVPTLVFVIPKFGAIAAAVSWAVFNLCALLASVYFMHHSILPREKWRWFASDTMLPIVTTGFLGAVLGLLSTSVQSRIGELGYLFTIAMALGFACLLSCSLVRRGALLQLRLVGAAVHNVTRWH